MKNDLIYGDSKVSIPFQFKIRNPVQIPKTPYTTPDGPTVTEDKSYPQAPKILPPIPARRHMIIVGTVLQALSVMLKKTAKLSMLKHISTRFKVKKIEVNTRYIYPSNSFFPVHAPKFTRTLILFCKSWAWSSISSPKLVVIMNMMAQMRIKIFVNDKNLYFGQR